MAANNAIGSASVVLSANADPLAKGLEKAQAKVQGFGAKIGDSFAGIAKDGTGPWGEALAKFGAVGVAAVAGFKVVGAGIDKFITQPLVAAGEEALAFRQKLDAIAAKASAKDSIRLDAIEAPGRRLAEFNAAADAELAKFQAATGKINTLKARLRDLDSGWNYDAWDAWAIGQYQSLAVAPKEAEIARLGEVAKASQARLEALREEAAKVVRAFDADAGAASAAASAKQIEFGQSIAEATKALELQAKTFNLSATAAQELQFQQAGASDAMLKAFRAAAETMKQLEAGQLPFLANLGKVASAFNLRASDALAVIPQFEAAAKKMNLLGDGLNPWRNGKPDEPGPARFAGAVEAGSAEAWSLEARNRFSQNVGANAAADAQKEANRKLDRLHDDLRDIRKSFENFASRISGV